MSIVPTGYTELKRWQRILPEKRRVAGPLNSELFAIPLEGGRYIVYAPLRQAAFVANAATVNLLADMKTRVACETSSQAQPLRDFLEALEIISPTAETVPSESFRGDPKPTSVTLLLTTACNLRCTYCYASAGDTALEKMPLSVAQRGIDFVCANALEKGETGFEIAFHGGGEPTSHWSVMTGAMRYAHRKAEESGLSVYATTATNGVLSNKKIDWIIDHLNGVSLSYDGLPSIQDKFRITPAGGGSSDKVLHTIRRFDQAQFTYGIRVTVTKQQIRCLPDSVEFICRRSNAQRIQVEPAYQMGRWRDQPSAETEDFIQQYRAAQVIAQSYGKEITFSAARVGLLTNHFCGISQDGFSLAASGNATACYEVFSEQQDWADNFFYAEPAVDGPGYRFNQQVLSTLRSQTTEHKPYCDGCFAKWHCAGDCHHKALAESGEGEFQGSDRCHITRELTKDQILHKIEQGGGVFWHEPPADMGHAPGCDHGQFEHEK